MFVLDHNKIKNKTARTKRIISSEVLDFRALKSLSECTNTYSAPKFGRRNVRHPNFNPYLCDRDVEASNILRIHTLKDGYCAATTEYLMKKYPHVFSSRSTTVRILNKLEQHYVINRSFSPYQKNSPKQVRYIAHCETYQILMVRLKEGNHWDEFHILRSFFELGIRPLISKKEYQSGSHRVYLFSPEKDAAGAIQRNDVYNSEFCDLAKKTIRENCSLAITDNSISNSCIKDEEWIIPKLGLKTIEDLDLAIEQKRRERKLFEETKEKSQIKIVQRSPYVQEKIAQYQINKKRMNQIMSQIADDPSEYLYQEQNCSSYAQRLYNDIPGSFDLLESLRSTIPNKYFVQLLHLHQLNDKFLLRKDKPLCYIKSILITGKIRHIIRRERGKKP